MKENKPVEIPEDDWAQTPPTVRAFVSQSLRQIEQLEARLQTAPPDAQAIAPPVEEEAPPSISVSETSPPRLRPRHTLNRLALIVLAVASAAAGQSLFAHDSLWDGLLLYTLAALLFVRGLRGNATSSSGQLWPDLTKPLELRQGARQTVGLVALTGAVLLSIIAYRAFGQTETIAIAWNFYLWMLKDEFGRSIVRAVIS